MPTTMTTPALEGSTYGIPFTFTDDLGVAVVPTSATWTLLKRGGSPPSETIVRGPVTITPLTSTYIIILSGTDLALVFAESPIRYVLVKYTYSSSLGTGLPANDIISFLVTNLVGVP